MCQRQALIVYLPITGFLRRTCNCLLISGIVREIINKICVVKLNIRIRIAFVIYGTVNHGHIRKGNIAPVPVHVTD